LKVRGVIKETATNVEETVVVAHEIGESVKHTAQHIGESAPPTSETLREATTKVKSKRAVISRVRYPVPDEVENACWWCMNQESRRYDNNLRIYPTTYPELDTSSYSIRVSYTAMNDDRWPWQYISH
jgi:hypothetical protein